MNINKRHLSLLLLAVVVTVLLGACDASEQNYDIEPGNSLGVVGPDEVTAPSGVGSYFVRAFTTNKEYTWSVEGPGAEGTVRPGRDGQYFDVTFDEPGTYVVSVEDNEDLSGSSDTVTVAYTDVVGQASRSELGFGALAAAIDVAGLTDTLSSDGPFTLLAPTDSALVATFDDDAEGAEGAGTVEEDELPAPEVLADILQYHVLPDSVFSSDLNAGQMVTTLEGDDVTFNVSGGAVTVTDGSPATEDATVTRADVPATNGVVHAIDQVLLPPTASASFVDQESAGDSVVVRSVYLPEGGFVAIHDSTLLDGVVAGSVIGVSEKLEAGLYNNVKVGLFDVPGGGFDEDMMLQQDQTLIAMPHFDTNGNGTYDFVTSGGAEDGAYTEDGSAVTSSAEVTVADE